MMKLAFALVALFAMMGTVMGTPSIVGYTKENTTVFTSMLEVAAMSQFGEDQDKVAFVEASVEAYDNGNAFMVGAGHKVFKVDNQFMQYVGFETVRFEGDTSTVFVFATDVEFQ